MQRVPTSHSWHINFWVNRITRFRDIDVGSWPKKTTKKTKFFWPPFIYRVNILDFGTVLTITLDDNSTTIFAYKQLGFSMDIEIFFSMSRVPRNQTWQPDNLTLLSIDMKTKVVQHDNYHDDYYDYHDNYHNENHDYRDDYHDAWTVNLSHLVHLWKHCFPCSTVNA